VPILFFKLVSAPALLVGLTLLVRRFGPRVGGLALGVPLTTGPISIFLALEHGADFAAAAAVGSLVGQAAACVFSFVFAWSGRRLSLVPTLIVAVLAYAVGMTAFNLFTWSFAPALGLLVGTVAILGIAMPRLHSAPRTVVAPWWDLPLRIVIAPAIILGVTALSAHTGPQFAGLIAPAPVMIAILGAFTLHACGADDAAVMMKAMVVGSLAFGAFFTVVAIFLREGALLPVYVAAAAASLAVSGMLYRFKHTPARLRP
jgi:hypothetical protein